jgi:hypothetical protein
MKFVGTTADGGVVVHRLVAAAATKLITTNFLSSWMHRSRCI